MKNMNNAKKWIKNIFLSSNIMPGRKLLTLLLLILRRVCIGKKIEHMTHYKELIRLSKLQYCRYCSRWREVVFTDGGRPSWSTIQKYDTRYCKIQLFTNHTSLSSKEILVQIDVIWYICDEYYMWKSFFEFLYPLPGEHDVILSQ